MPRNQLTTIYSELGSEILEVRLVDFTNRAWTVQNKKEPSFFLKIESEHRQQVSSKFLKSFRCACDLVLFSDFCFMIFRGFV